MNPIISEKEGVQSITCFVPVSNAGKVQEAKTEK
jgi:hypothetical protein